MVPESRFELERGCPQRCLRPPRLPVPPLRLDDQPSVSLPGRSRGVTQPIRRGGGGSAIPARKMGPLAALPLTRSSAYWSPCTSRITSARPRRTWPLLAGFGAADLITVTADGLLATMLPLVHEPPGSTPDAGSSGRCSVTWHATTASGRCRPSVTRSSSSAGRMPTSRRPGMRPSGSTAGWSRRGTTSRPTSTVGWWSTTIRPGSRRMCGP